jgi:mono/diheme cytochrome c family protein
MRRPLLSAGAALAAVWVAATTADAAPEPQAVLRYEKTIVPLLEKYCYDCHGNGLNKGKVTLDEFKSLTHAMEPRGMWLAALRNVRAGLMPPLEKDAARPEAAEIDTLTQWIKADVFGLDPKQPDPGAVTVRRLNRVEYRNTIRDLMGYDFNSEVEFPPDDSGNGFDNNGDVLTVSPLLLEK